MEYLHERDQMIFMRGYKTALLDLYCVATANTDGVDADNLAMVALMLTKSQSKLKESQLV